MPALDELVEAALLAADAGADVGHAARVCLVGPLGVGQKWAAQHDHVAVTLAQGALGDVGIAQLAHGHHRHGQARVGADAVRLEALAHGACHGHEAARGHARGWVGHPPVVVAAKVDVEHVHARCHEVLHVREGLLDGPSAAHAAQVGRAHDLLAIGLLQREREVDAVHDGVVGPHAAADLGDDVQAKAAPVGISAQLAVVEGGVGQLLDEVALVAVQVDAVDPHGVRVGRCLADVLDDAAQLAVGQAHARDRRDVEVGQEACRARELALRDQALRVAHAPQARRQLHEDSRAVGVDALRQVAPAAHDGAAAVDAREVGELVQLGHGRVDPVAHGHQARGDQAAAALRAREEVLQHHVVGTTRLLAHVDVAHRRHDHAVLDRQPVDLDWREEPVIGVELLRHARGTAAGARGSRVGLVGGVSVGRGVDAGRVRAVRGPVVKRVDELLYQSVLSHTAPCPFVCC